MDIRDLRYFVAVAQNLNITQAAEQLFISRQALSKSIHNLEEECGSELFLRCHGKLQMTHLGQNLLEKSFPILDSFNDLEKCVNPNLWGNKSKIRVAVGLGILSALSPEIFANFSQDYPKIDISVIEVCDDEVRRNLDSDEIDIGVLNSTPDRLQAYNYKLIQGRKIWLQVSKNNPLSEKDYITPRDLQNQPFVTLGERFDIHNVLMEKCRIKGFCPKLVLETIDSNAANSMVYNNLAISFANPSANSITYSTIRVLPIDLGGIVWGIYVISKKGFKSTASTNLLVDYLGSMNGSSKSSANKFHQPIEPPP